MNEPIKSLDFLPDFDKDLEFFQNVAPIIDHILEEYEKEFKYIKDKYADFYNFEDVLDRVSKEAAIKELIKEKGYEPLVDILDLQTEDIAIVYAYLKVFRYLKGTREGLELVFQVLGFKRESLDPLAPKTYEFTQWWEQLPKGEPYTFDAFIKFPLSTPNFSDLLVKIKKFFRFYVYPILRNLQLVLDFLFVDSVILHHSYYDQLAVTTQISETYTMFHCYYDRELTNELPEQVYNDGLIMTGMYYDQLADGLFN